MLIKADAKFDKDNQKTDWMHGMRSNNPVGRLSAEQTAARMEESKSDNISQAAKATTDKDATKFLAAAEHPVSDVDCPSHNYATTPGNFLFTVEGSDHIKADLDDKSPEGKAAFEKSVAKIREVLVEYKKAREVEAAAKKADEPKKEEKK